MSILITTYEGTHNHPLTAAATAMASTTSAAATMLLSGSSSSSSATRPDALAGFNTFESSNNNNKQFYMPNNASTYSSFQASHPTITLDLTSTHLPNPNNNNSNNNTSHHFLNKFSNNNSNTYPSSSLSFGSSDSNNTSNNMSWGNYGTSSAQAQQYRAALGGLGRQISTPFSQNPNANNNNYYQNYIHHKISTNPSPSSANDSSAIAAATKAITADPTFQSALAAALTSIIGGGQGSNGSKSSNILQGEVVPNLKWPIVNSGDHQVHFPATTSSATTNNALLLF